MSKFINNIPTILKTYTVIALVVSATLSPLALSFIHIIVLLWFLYQWRWPLSQLINFLTLYFTFFAVGLLFTPITGPYFACTISLPLVIAIDIKLCDIGQKTRPETSTRRRSPSNIFIVILSITLGTLTLGILAGSIELLLSCGAVIIYFLALGIIIWRKLSSQPVVGEPILIRGIAGREIKVVITLKRQSVLKGMLFLGTDYQWCKIIPNTFIPLGTDQIRIQCRLIPPLAGPSNIDLDACVIDPWGLFQVKFKISAIKLVIVPRAKYADWLAKKYLSGAKLGQLPLVSNISSIKPLYGLRRGVEFYGIKMYQQGDSLKNIDWKHSVKYNELVTKEFIEIQAQSAIILINLVTNDFEAADKLAYNIVVSGLCLAQNGIPAGLAVYTDENVVMTTQSLSTQELVMHTREIVKEIITKQKTVKYLNPPDVIRLRANISRLEHTESRAAKVLRELLQAELKNLGNIARSNPCTQALNMVMAKTNKQSTIYVISNHNHDVEALAFNEFTLADKGNTIIIV